MKREIRLVIAKSYTYRLQILNYSPIIQPIPFAALSTDDRNCDGGNCQTHTDKPHFLISSSQIENWDWTAQTVGESADICAIARQIFLSLFWISLPQQLHGFTIYIATVHVYITIRECGKRGRRETERRQSSFTGNFSKRKSTSCCVRAEMRPILEWIN